MAIHNKSGIENIFFKKRNTPTDSEGSKIYCEFFKRIPNLLEGLVFEHGGCHLIGHDPVSKRKK